MTKTVEFSPEDQATLHVQELVAAGAEITRLEKLRDEQTQIRRAAVTGLRGLDWSLQKIADTIGISKTAVAQIERSGK